MPDKDIERILQAQRDTAEAERAAAAHAAVRARSVDAAAREENVDIPATEAAAEAPFPLAQHPADTAALGQPALQPTAQLQHATPPGPRVVSPQTAHMPAVQDLLQQLLTQQRMEGQQFFLVVLPDDAAPRLEEFTDSVTLVARIRTLIGADVYLFPFLGHALKITRGPHRYLTTPFGPLPLFSIPSVDALEVEDSGYVGVSPPSLEPPEAPEPPDDDIEDDEDVDDYAEAADAGEDDLPI